MPIVLIDSSSRICLMFFGVFVITSLFFFNLILVDAISDEEIPMPFSSSIAYFPPPLKQISQGIDPSNVTCTESKSLVLKQSNGLPACVNHSSIEKLILRGWAIHILPNYIDQNNNSEIFTLGTYSTESEMIIYHDNISGYLAKPIVSGNYPGVIMIHEWW